MKLTSHTLIKDFPRGLKELALKRAAEQGLSNESALNKNIDSAITWSRTEEGYEFWSDVHYGREFSWEETTKQSKFKRGDKVKCQDGSVGIYVGLSTDAEKAIIKRTDGVGWRGGSIIPSDFPCSSEDKFWFVQDNELTLISEEIPEKWDEKFPFPSRWWCRWTCLEDVEDFNEHFSKNWLYFENAVVSQDGRYHSAINHSGASRLGQEITPAQFRKYVLKKAEYPAIPKEAIKSKFQVGDRVEATSSGNTVGKTSNTRPLMKQEEVGTVLDIDGEDVNVGFSDGTNTWRIDKFLKLASSQKIASTEKISKATMESVELGIDWERLQSTTKPGIGCSMWIDGSYVAGLDLFGSVGDSLSHIFKTEEEPVLQSEILIKKKESKKKSYV